MVTWLMAFVTKDLKDRLAALEKEKQDWEAAIKEADSQSEKDANKTAEDLKKRLEDEKEERKRQEEEVIGFTEDALQRKNKLTEDQLNQDLELRKRNIDQQQQLAISGRANTLAFEEAAAAKDELRKQQQAIKEQKQARAIALFKLITAAAEHGKDAPAALAEALVTIGIAGAIAGSYYEGTENVGEDLKGNKMHNGRDGYLIAADGSERIMTGDQNKMVGDMTNEELAQLAYNYQMGNLPYITKQDMSFGENLSNSLLIQQFGELTKEISEIKHALKERPVSHIELNKLGEVVETKITNGLKKITTHKNGNNYV